MNYKTGLCSEASAILFYYMSQLKIFPIAFVYVSNPTNPEVGHCFLITGENVNTGMTLETLQKTTGFVLDLWAGMVYKRELLCTDTDHLKTYQSEKISVGAESLHNAQHVVMPADEAESTNTLIQNLTERCLSLLSDTCTIDPTYDFSSYSAEKYAHYLDPQDLVDKKRSDNYEKSVQNLSAMTISRFWKKYSANNKKNAEHVKNRAVAMTH